MLSYTRYEENTNVYPLIKVSIKTIEGKKEDIMGKFIDERMEWYVYKHYTIMHIKLITMSMETP